MQGSGSISGKQQITDAPEGITSNTSLTNLIANLDIPISEKISLIGDVQYNKFREKIEQGDEELFLQDPGSDINKRLGIGFDSGTGITASAIKDLETGDNEYRVDLKKPIDFNKFLLRRADGGPARQNFKMGKRAFLKILGGVGAGIAGLKSGILGLGGKGATKKAVTETIKQSAGSGTPPPYFFKLVEKIKTLGDDTLATQDKTIAKKYKDYTMEEDFAGNIEIIKKNNDIAEDVYMSYKVDEVPTKIGKKKSTKVEEYEEFTARPDGDGKMKDIEPGVPDSVVMEVEAGSGNVPESFYTGLNPIKKADGGRIGFNGGGSPLQQLRQSLVDDLMYKFPNMKEQDMQMIVKDINLDMSPEEAQASMSGNFTKVFGSSGMFSTGGRVPLAGGKLADPGYFMFQDLDEDKPYRYEYDESKPEHIKIIRDRLKKKTQELIKQGIIERKLFSEADRMPASNPYFLEFMEDKNLGTGAGEATPEELEKQKRMFSLKQEVKDGGRIGFDGGGLAGMLGE